MDDTVMAYHSSNGVHARGYRSKAPSGKERWKAGHSVVLCFQYKRCFSGGFCASGPVFVDKTLLLQFPVLMEYSNSKSFLTFRTWMGVDKHIRIT